MSADTQLRKDACKAAKALLDSDDDYLDKIVKLWKIGNQIYDECWDTEFYIFGLIESETDHLPTKETKRHCSINMLNRTKEEIEKTIHFYKQDVNCACNEILSIHKNV